MLAEIATVIPYPLINEWIKKIIDDRHFHDKHLRFYLKSGPVISGRFERYSQDHRMIFVSGKVGSRGVPVDNLLYVDVQPVTQELPSSGYSFAGIPYTLRDFPTPFVKHDGTLDLIAVYGEGSRDYAEHRQFQRRNGEKTLLTTKVGRRGDFEYLATLFAALGFAASRLRPQSELSISPLAKQGLRLDDADLLHNLILVGSGAINTFSRRILEIFGDDLPVRFKASDSDEEIIDQTGPERKIYSRRIDAEWDIGFIELLPNPFCPSKVILIAAGLTVTGTQAALHALCDATSRKVLNDTVRVTEGESIIIPAQLVRATDIHYRNGLESARSYDFV